MTARQKKNADYYSSLEALPSPATTSVTGSHFLCLCVTIAGMEHAGKRFVFSKIQQTHDFASSSDAQAPGYFDATCMHGKHCSSARLMVSTGM